jgi:hypothetical protein
MSSIPLLFNIIFACVITLIFLYRCGNYRRQHPITTGAVFIAWSFSVLFVFLLPLDISLVNILLTCFSDFYFYSQGCLSRVYEKCPNNNNGNINSYYRKFQPSKKKLIYFLNVKKIYFIEYFSREFMSSTMVLCRPEIL